MTAIPLNAYKRRPKFQELTDEEALRLVKIIKRSSDKNGILIMKTLRNSIKKALSERRQIPTFKSARLNYKWDNPKGWVFLRH